MKKLCRAGSCPALASRFWASIHRRRSARARWARARAARSIGSGYGCLLLVRAMAARYWLRHRSGSWGGSMVTSGLTWNDLSGGDDGGDGSADRGEDLVDPAVVHVAGVGEVRPADP